MVATTESANCYTEYLTFFLARIQFSFVICFRFTSYLILLTAEHLTTCVVVFMPCLKYLVAIIDGSFAWGSSRGARGAEGEGKYIKPDYIYGIIYRWRRGCLVCSCLTELALFSDTATATT